MTSVLSAYEGSVIPGKSAHTRHTICRLADLSACSMCYCYVAIRQRLLVQGRSMFRLAVTSWAVAEDGVRHLKDMCYCFWQCLMGAGNGNNAHMTRAELRCWP
jgi:hypothetical protein